MEIIDYRRELYKEPTLSMLDRNNILKRIRKPLLNLLLYVNYQINQFELSYFNYQINQFESDEDCSSSDEDRVRGGTEEEGAEKKREMGKGDDLTTLSSSYIHQHNKKRSQLQCIERFSTLLLSYTIWLSYSTLANCTWSILLDTSKNYLS